MKKEPKEGVHERARVLRREMTEAEKRLWQVLRIAANPWVRRQVPIGRFVADSVCHEARLIVEIDGGQRDASSEPEASRTSTSLRKLAHVIPTFSSCPRKRASRAQAPEAALDSRLRGSDDTRV